jgi:hypothetical protein
MFITNTVPPAAMLSKVTAQAMVEILIASVIAYVIVVIPNGTLAASQRASARPADRS